MSKKQDKKMVKALREGGIRKKVARTLTDATGRSSRRRRTKAVESTIDSFRSAATELEKRLGSATRSEAGKKAARTRKRKAAARRASARKGARTRARA